LDLSATRNLVAQPEGANSSSPPGSSPERPWLGAEIARAALRDGDNVVVAVRNPDRVPDDLKTAVTAMVV